MWSRKHTACVSCNTTERRHWAKGLCRKCFAVALRKGQTHDPLKWSKKYDRCQECGSTARPHSGHGLCFNCYHRNNMRRLSRLQVSA